MASRNQACGSSGERHALEIAATSTAASSGPTNRRTKIVRYLDTSKPLVEELLLHTW